MEFELVVYNALHNLGKAPQINVAILELEGVKTADHPVFESYADAKLLREYLLSKHLDFDKIKYGDSGAGQNNF
jgi:hypothetical protein